MTPRSFDKLFCIGLNKTGTRSLHRALGRLGLRSLHHAPGATGSPEAHQAASRRLRTSIETARRSGRPLLTGYEDYDAYSDVEDVTRNFELLDRQYPGSLFIHTDRESEDWVDSRRRHVQANRRRKALGQYQGDFLEIAPERWRHDQRVHRERVTAYFHERPEDLLVLDICGGDGWEKLCAFLGMQPPTDAFPWIREDALSGFGPGPSGPGPSQEARPGKR